MSNIKILSAVLSFLLLFAISCSNEGTTGGIVITKTEIEDMIQSMGTVSITSSGNVGANSEAIFDFSEKDKIVFQNNKPNFKVKAPEGGEGGGPTSSSPYSISTASDAIVKKLTGNEENYKKYFSDCNKKHHESDGANLTLYFQFTLKSGYALSSEVAHLTSDGLSIQLTLQNDENWGE